MLPDIFTCFVDYITSWEARRMNSKFSCFYYGELRFYYGEQIKMNTFDMWITINLHCICLLACPICLLRPLHFSSDINCKVRSRTNWFLKLRQEFRFPACILCQVYFTEGKALRKLSILCDFLFVIQTYFLKLILWSDFKRKIPIWRTT